MLDARMPAQTSPEAEVVTDDEKALLWHALARLPERCQKLLRIVAWEPRPDYSSVAESLDMPIGSIGPTRRRCLDKLRVELGSCVMSPDDDQLLDAIADLYAELDPAPDDLAEGVLARLAVEDLETEYELLTLVERVDDASGTRDRRGAAPATHASVALEFAGSSYRVLVRISTVDGAPPTRRLGRSRRAAAGLPRPARATGQARQSATSDARRPLRVPRPDDGPRCGCGCCPRPPTSRRGPSRRS